MPISHKFTTPLPNDPVKVAAGQVSANAWNDTHTNPDIADVTNLTSTLAAKADLVGGKVPAAQLPAYVDDVLEFANFAAFPVTGSAGIIYVADDTGKVYRWSGSSYIEISPSDVNSVFGRTGAVMAQSGDYTTALVTESGNLYFTDERAQDAVGAMVDSTLVYVDATPLLTRAAITGDVSIAQASNTATLATVNSNVGSFTNANVTVDGKGRITAASNGSAGGITYNVNTTRTDQTPAGTGYTTLGGTVNGTNAVFTVSNGSYVSGTLRVNLNGPMQTIGAGNDFNETAPGSGTFTFVTPPPTGSIIIAEYITQANTNYTTTPTGTVWTATANKQVTNTNVETSAVPTSGVGSLVIPANGPIVGRSYRLNLFGTYQTPALPGAVTVRIKIGTVTVATVVVNASILAANSTTNELYGEAVVTYRTIGSTGTLTCNGFLIFEIASGTVELGFSTAQSNGTNPLNDTVVVNTTVASLFDVTETWSNAQAGQGTVIGQGTLEVLN